MIRVTDDIAIEESEIFESFVRSSGPGGQNVNKVATAVQLRFDARRSPSLSEPVRMRVERLAGARLRRRRGCDLRRSLSYAGAEPGRSLERLLSLIRRAADLPKPRRPTRPTTASKERRLKGKSERGGVRS